ncbi:TPA: hypothetical protein TZ303_001443 [Streptococcus suis]|nr:hypothetical protein [Streptococcus suis]
MKKFVYSSLLLLSVATLAACSSSSESTTSSSSATSESTTVESTTTSSSAEKTSYSVGETIVFDGQAEITVTGAEFTDERNEFADQPAERVLKITFNVNNISDKDYVIGDEFSLYVGSSKMETYPLDMTMDTISAGRSYENATIAFAVNGTGELELEVVPSFSFGEKAQIVKLDLQ